MACKHMFIEEDGYCTMCGTVVKITKRASVPTYTDLRKKTETKRVTTKVQPKVSKPQANLKDLLGGVLEPAQIVHTTLKYLCGLFDLKVELKITHGKSGYHQYFRKTGEHRIILGRKRIDGYLKYGFSEYKTLRHLIGYKELTGVDCFVQFVLHEFAHALQLEIPNGRTYGSVHNKVFVEQYKRVMEAVGINHRK